MTPTIAVQGTINYINQIIIGRLTCMLNRVCAPVRARLFQVLEGIDKHHATWPFHAPVSLDHVPGYLDVINEPTGI